MTTNEKPCEWGRCVDLCSAKIKMIASGPSSLRLAADTLSILILLAPQSAWHVIIGAERKSLALAPAGTVQVFPIASSCVAQWEAPMESLLVTIAPSRLHDILATSATHSSICPLRGKHCVDNLALDIAREIRREIDMEAVGQRQCLNAWVDLLLSHLLRTHSNLTPTKPPPSSGGLGARARKETDQYISMHLSERIRLKELAAAANLSVSHFTRAFRTTFGLPPHQYVLSVRLHHARQLIVGSDLPFGHIARNAGFANNSHLTSAMRKHYGMTPTQIRLSSKARAHDPIVNLKSQ